MSSEEQRAAAPSPRGGGGRSGGGAAPAAGASGAGSPPPPAPSPPAAPAAPGDGEQPGDAAGALRAALSSLVDKPSLYLVRAAQATTLRQLKAARKQLRDFSTAARVQFDGQLAALEGGAAHLAALRADLDAAHAALRARRQQLLDAHPEMRHRLAAARAELGGGGDDDAL
ncbi:hypothetical protein Rsub_10636 [Raphidocelis subcapitata]|uniref:Biogenesis of lysosome-related organelles complex 1 subunit KXD1 n=1 Tax=Raphidocelis subcapitata TaxID=307507 RepID=A0A2V0PJ09_9CHLO|nr:hypothetical protein Rsub_10636 [Raphidocelis subcapitata]|eukprot:GBF97963.1 hypothetical protein Rsub_10636 [Raphidocelis subcapitata]